MLVSIRLMAIDSNVFKLPHWFTLNKSTDLDITESEQSFQC
jgi:hypothetical protein